MEISVFVIVAVVVVAVFMVPIIALLTEHQRKMTQLLNHQSAGQQPDAELRSLHSEVRELHGKVLELTEVVDRQSQVMNQLLGLKGSDQDSALSERLEDRQR